MRRLLATYLRTYRLRIRIVVLVCDRWLFVPQTHCLLLAADFFVARSSVQVHTVFCCHANRRGEKDRPRAQKDERQRAKESESGTTSEQQKQRANKAARQRRSTCARSRGTPISSRKSISSSSSSCSCELLYPNIHPRRSIRS